ncbi:MAG: metallophosphoesterase [Betaproteobacteria bacterium]|nr:MAG: metallophosphoesterase [Betaproteobacteria bacterium]
MLRLFSFVLLLHLYIGLRLLPDMPFGTLGVAALGGWLIVSTSLTPLGLLARRIKRQPLSDRLAWAGLLAIGSLSSLLVLTLIRDVVLLVGHAVSGWLFEGDLLQQFKSSSAVAVPLLAGLFTLVGLINARRRAKVRSVNVPIVDLPAPLHGFTIAQISDVHIGPTIKREYVAAIVDAVNQLDADMIAVTGDLVDGSVKQLSVHTQPLSRLSARHGAFFVTGNHEYYSGVSGWVAELRRLGLCVLMNEHVVLRHKGGVVVVAGVTDYSAHHYDRAQQSDPAAAIAGAPTDAAVKLLLAHQPRSAFAAEPAGFHLQLSGHTHGGQFWPWTFFVRLQQPFTAGLRRLGSLWVYTSRGTGYWGPPQRLGAPSEITHLRLVPA